MDLIDSLTTNQKEFHGNADVVKTAAADRRIIGQSNDDFPFISGVSELIWDWYGKDVEVIYGHASLVNHRHSLIS